MMNSNLFATTLVMLSMLFSISAYTADPVFYDDFCTEFEEDRDSDGVPDESDNCPDTYNPTQDDSDKDGIGDVCDDDDCGCNNEDQLIIVCQDNMTRRVECSGLGDYNTFCGPCESLNSNPCSTCTPDEDGLITICVIPFTRDNLRTFRGECNQLGRFFNTDGTFADLDNVCGPCNCALVDDVDTDGDGVCDRTDECPDDPTRSEAGMCGCDDQDSDNDWVCDSVDICPGGNDKNDDDGDGVPNLCDICPGFDDSADMDGDGIPDGCDSPDTGNGDGNTGFQVCETADTINTDVLFVIDNSQSISIEEYALFEQTIVATIANIQANCPTSRVAVMHYGGDFGQEVSIELDFENGRSITSVQRQFCVEQPCPSGGDDLNSAMNSARELMTNGTLGHLSENGLEIVIFSDAFTGLECEGPGAFVNCSQIEPYDGIDALKASPFDASVTVVGATVQAEASRLALYASPGGSFADVVLDPVCDQTFDGCSLPRQYIPVEFNSPVAATAAQIASLVTCGAQIVALNDSDNDGICDLEDICMGFDDNLDSDGDGVPDGCDNDMDTGMNDTDTGMNNCTVGDSDNDGVCDDVDVCLGFDDNADADGDGIPDGCDSCVIGDSDNDGVCDDVDVCLGFNDNADADGDGIPDGCDSCVVGDSDNDGVCDDVDVCLGFNDNADADGDGIPDGCDSCVVGDSDNDGVCDDVDVCLGFNDNADADGDGIPDGCDQCNAGDVDNDGICDDIDTCLQGNDNFDADLDGVPDACDACPLDFFNDFDGDGVCDSNDLCPGFDDRIDGDGDGIPDGCDPCPFDASNDSDNDGVCDSDDICPNGDDNVDVDGNGIPDACDETKSFCDVQGDSRFEWIDDVKIGDVFNQSGNDGGFADFSDIVVEFDLGESFDVWINTGFFEDICEISHYGFIDWNCDGDFDDAEEFAFLSRSIEETGGFITVPSFAVVGRPLRFRIIATYGRIDDACDSCISGEVEDYSLLINNPTGQTSGGTSQTAPPMVNIQVTPNPSRVGSDLIVQIEGAVSANATGLLMDLQGNVFHRTVMREGFNRVSTAGLEAGPYIFDYMDGNDVQRIMVILQD